MIHDMKFENTEYIWKVYPTEQVTNPTPPRKLYTGLTALHTKPKSRKCANNPRLVFSTDLIFFMSSVTGVITSSCHEILT